MKRFFGRAPWKWDSTAFADFSKVYPSRRKTILANHLTGNPPPPKIAAVIGIPRHPRRCPSSSASGRAVQHDDRQVMSACCPWLPDGATTGRYRPRAALFNWSGSADEQCASLVCLLAVGLTPVASD